MGKYFDKLLKMNESLTREMKDRGLYMEEENKETIEISPDALTDEQKKEIMSDKGVDDEILKNMHDHEEIDTALKTAMNMDEKDARNESLNTDASMNDWDGPAIIANDDDSFYVKDGEWTTDISNAYEFPSKEDAEEKIRQLGDGNMDILPATMKKDELDESINESDGEVYLRMDDDDLDIHGYVKWNDGEKVEFVDSEKEADIFPTKVEADAAILDICDKYNYDPETFSTQEVDSQVANDGENWVSLDPTDVTATTIA